MKIFWPSNTAALTPVRAPFLSRSGRGRRRSIRPKTKNIRRQRQKQRQKHSQSKFFVFVWNCGHTYVQAGWMPVYCGHTYVQPGWTGVRPPWTPGCPSWFLFSILYQKELIFLKDISQHDWSINSLIFGDFIFLKFLNIFPELGQTPVHGWHTPVLWTTGCPCQGYQYCFPVSKLFSK